MIAEVKKIILKVKHFLKPEPWNEGWFGFPGMANSYTDIAVSLLFLKAPG